MQKERKEKNIDNQTERKVRSSKLCRDTWKPPRKNMQKVKRTRADKSKMEERVERNMVQKYSNKKNSQEKAETTTMKKTKEYKNRNIERKNSNTN